MPITWQRLFDPERAKLAPPLAWAIGAAAVMSVFAVVAIIVNYAPLNKGNEQRIEEQLPRASYETLATLIRLSGSPCAQVCSVTGASSLTGSSTVEVACALPDQTNSCETPLRYRLNVEAVSGPQR